MFLFALLFLQLLGTIGATEGIVMGQIVLYLAMSVDGYIADEQGGVGWLAGDGSEPDAPRQEKDQEDIFFWNGELTVLVDKLKRSHAGNV